MEQTEQNYQTDADKKTKVCLAEIKRYIIEYID